MKKIISGVILLLFAVSCTSIPDGEQEEPISSGLGPSDYLIEVVVATQSELDSMLWKVADATKPDASCNKRYQILEAKSSIEDGHLKTAIRLNREDWCCLFDIIENQTGQDSGWITQLHKPVLLDGKIEFMSEEPEVFEFHWVEGILDILNSLFESLLANILNNIDITEEFDLEDSIKRGLKIDPLIIISEIVGLFIPPSLLNVDKTISELTADLLRQCSNTDLEVVKEGDEIKVKGYCRLSA